jgi:predicted nucleic acid-binding Zn ribbon protein
MAELYCPRCGKAMKGGLMICPECIDELNNMAARRRKMMSLGFTIIVAALVYMMYRSGRLNDVLKIFTSLKFSSKTAEELISKLS